MTEGWIAGMVIEAALKGPAGPRTPRKIAASHVEPEGRHQGPARRPIEWTKDNHFRTQQDYRVYRWDEAKSAIVRVQRLGHYDVK